MTLETFCLVFAAGIIVLVAVNKQPNVVTYDRDGMTITRGRETLFKMDWASIEAMRNTFAAPYVPPKRVDM